MRNIQTNPIPEFGGPVRTKVDVLATVRAFQSPLNSSRHQVKDQILILKLFLVNDIREGELKLIRLNALYQAVVILLWEITPYLVQVVCFAAYMSQVGFQNNVMTSNSHWLLNRDRSFDWLEMLPTHYQF